MNIANFFGLRPFLMNEADGGEGGGGGGTTALATTDTALATTGGEQPVADETALETTQNETHQTDNARKPANPALAVLSSHEDPNVKKFGNTAVRAIAFRQKIGTMFPGSNPITAIESLQRDMVGLAGRNWNTPDPRDEARRTGLQQVRDKLAEIEGIDLMFYSGNPQLLDGMTADDEGKAAFAKLAPHMDSKWREVAPNAWTAKTARQILADMTGAQLTNDKGEVVASADIPYRAQRLALALKGDKDGVVSPLDLQLARNEVVAINAYLQRLTALTNVAAEVFTQPGEAKDSKLAERERKLAEREANNRNTDWNNARQIMANQVTTKTWNQLVKGHDIPADDQEECIALFQRRFDQSIKMREPRADESRRGYIEADDRDGYLAYENYLMTTYGVPALKEQVKRMLAKMTPAKQGAKAAVTAPNGQPAAKTTPQGFVKLAAKPPTHVLNYDGMNPELIKAKKWVLRLPWDGKPAGTRVTW